MASVAYLNAGMDYLLEHLPELAQQLPDIPFVDEQRIALEKLNSKEGRAVLFHLWKGAVGAAEAGDAKAKEA
jgi:hypothetical protein